MTREQPEQRPKSASPLESRACSQEEKRAKPSAPRKYNGFSRIESCNSKAEQKGLLMQGLNQISSRTRNFLLVFRDSIRRKDQC